MKIATVTAIQSFLTARDFSPRTLEQYRWALDYLIKECPELPKTPDPIRQALKKILKPWAKDACWRVWKSFFRWCSREYRIINAMDWVDRHKPPEVEMESLELADLAMVLASAKTVRDRVIIALALDAGIRASEFGRLRVADIHGGAVKVFGKRRKLFRVPISPETESLIRILLSGNGHNPQSLLFPGMDGKPLSRYAVYRIVRQCMERAGIPGPKRGPHILRHSLGANFIADGGDPFTLKRVMRHENIATTQRYVTLPWHAVIEQHNLHSPFRKIFFGTQGNLFENNSILKEAQAILAGKGGEDGHQD